MNLVEWRSNTHLVSEAIKIMSDPIFKKMLEVMQEEHPHRSVPKADASPDKLLGIIYGYNHCLDQLSTLAIPLKPLPEEPQTTWGAETEQ